MSDRIDDTSDTPIAPAPDRRPLRVLLLGDRDDVIATIQNLHRRGFAPAGEWSRPIPCPTGEAIARLLPNLPIGSVTSILTRYVNRAAE